jgi:uncharacterized membrane protein
MSKVEDFLTSVQEQEIIEAIRLAEKDTSGEIRVHLEKSTEKDAIERAKEVFYFLKMDETKLQNGVLFYIKKIYCTNTKHKRKKYYSLM